MTYTTYYTEPNVNRRCRTSGRPSVDIEDQKDHYLLTAELPGISREDLEIEVKENILILRHAATQNETADRKYLMRERRNRSNFERSFILPKDADRENINASMENGVLHLTIARVPAQKPRKITVKAG